MNLGCASSFLDGLGWPPSPCASQTEAWVWYPRPSWKPIVIIIMGEECLKPLVHVYELCSFATTPITLFFFCFWKDHVNMEATSRSANMSEQDAQQYFAAGAHCVLCQWRLFWYLFSLGSDQGPQ